MDLPDTLDLYWIPGDEPDHWEASCDPSGDVDITAQVYPDSKQAERLPGACWSWWISLSIRVGDDLVPLAYAEGIGCDEGDALGAAAISLRELWARAQHTLGLVGLGWKAPP